MWNKKSDIVPLTFPRSVLLKLDIALSKVYRHLEKKSSAVKHLAALKQQLTDLEQHGKWPDSYPQPSIRGDQEYLNRKVDTATFEHYKTDSANSSLRFLTENTTYGQLKRLMFTSYLRFPFRVDIRVQEAKVQDLSTSTRATFITSLLSVIETELNDLEKEGVELPPSIMRQAAYKPFVEKLVDDTLIAFADGVGIAKFKKIQQRSSRPCLKAEHG